MLTRRALLFGFTVIGLSACGGGRSNSGGDEDNPEEEGSEERTPNIIVLGDSIAAGTKASSNFPDLLAGITGIQTQNYGFPGASAERTSSLLPDLIRRFKPTYVASLLGTNNANNNNGNGVEGAINAALFITRVTLENDAIPILGTLPPIGHSAGNARASAISSGIRGVGGARIADIRAAFSGAHLGGDGLHPNDAGQRLIAELFAQQVF